MAARQPAAPVLLVVAVAGLCPACGCSEDSGAAGGTGGMGGSGAASGGTGALGGTGGTGGGGGTGGDAGPCQPTGFVPPQVPEGWEPYFDFSCSMPFWVPSTAAALPLPIVWEKCNQYAPEGIDCRAMKLDWPHELAPVTQALVTAEPGKPVRVLFGRNTIGGGFNTWIITLLADADGPVHMAIGQTHQLTQGLSTNPQGLHQDHFAIGARGGAKSEHADDSPVQGALVGKVGELRPNLFRKEVTDSTLSWGITPQYVIRGSALEQTVFLYPRDGFGESTLLVSSATDPDGLQVSMPIATGADLFVDMGSLYMSGITAYAPVAGPVPLIRWPGDTTQGAYNIGTDGQHLVWTYGEKPAGTPAPYPKRSIMVSSYTTDPAKIAATRLRSDPNQAFGQNFAVGCGYAAKSAGSTVGTIIVRLADGWSWRLNDNGSDWLWLRVRAISCEEVFVDAHAKSDGLPQPVLNLARVRLDSLGPGEAPD